MSATALTFAELAEALHRPAVVITSLQHRFELPTLAATGYSKAYVAFLQTLLSLRALAMSEDRTLDLWQLEK